MIYHITSHEAWKAAEEVGQYTADSLASEGFIHCSEIDQVVDVANSFYKGQQGLVLLAIDESALTAELRHEDSHQNGELFPHIYGPLNLDAVLNVIEFPCDQKGEFQLPPALT